MLTTEVDSSSVSKNAWNGKSSVSVAKKGFFRRVRELLGFVKPESKKTEPETQTPTAEKPSPPKTSIFSADKEDRRRKQRKLKAKRKQIEYRSQRQKITQRRSAKLPTVHETAAHIVREHNVTSPSQKLRVMRRVRHMSEVERRHAVMMNSDELAEAARDQYPETKDSKGNAVNPFWYH
jgi:hypothetical protein